MSKNKKIREGVCALLAFSIAMVVDRNNLIIDFSSYPIAISALLRLAFFVALFYMIKGVVTAGAKLLSVRSKNDY